MLLTSAVPGTVDYIDADLREPGKVLRAAARSLDFTRPVAIMLIAVMHLIVDDDDPYGILSQLKAAMVPGGYLVLSQVAADIETEQVAEARRRYNRLARETQRHRTREEVTRFFDGLDLVEPGVVSTTLWRPEPGETPQEIAVYCGVARKP